MIEMDKCNHDNWELKRIENGKAIALCAGCGEIIYTDISSFLGNYQALLYYFIQDVCSGCDRYEEYFEGGESLMPGLIPGGIGCKEGVREILKLAF